MPNAARADAFTLLAGLERTNDHSTLFRATETYRSGAEGSVMRQLELVVRGG